MFHKQYVSFPTRLFGLMVHKQTLADLQKYLHFSLTLQNWTHAARDNAEFSWGYCGTALIQIERCPEQRWVTETANCPSLHRLLLYYFSYEQALNYYKNCENLRKCDEI